MYTESCIIFLENKVLVVILVNCNSLLTLQDENNLMDAYAKKYAFSRSKLSCMSVSTIVDPR